MTSTKNTTENIVSTIIPVNFTRPKLRDNIYLQIIYNDTDNSPFMDVKYIECEYRKRARNGYIVMPIKNRNNFIKVSRDCLDKILIRPSEKVSDTIIFEGLFSSKLKAIREFEKWRECIGRYTETLRME